MMGWIRAKIIQIHVFDVVGGDSIFYRCRHYNGKAINFKLFNVASKASNNCCQL